MSRIPNVPIRVTTRGGKDGKPIPLSFQRGPYRYEITKILDQWTAAESWWLDPDWQNPKESRWFRVALTDGGIMEIFEGPGGSWRLWKVYD